jgi:hypothetical protein
MGKLHGNVDTLSRPVWSAISSVEVETTVDKIIEPYQDDFMLNFLKHQKDLPGSSKKKIKRIEKQMSKYKYDLKMILCIKGNLINLHLVTYLNCKIETIFSKLLTD